MMRTADAQIVELGQRVRRRRERMGMTLAGLAERSGLSSNYIGMIENGKRDPSLETLRALAKGLDADPGELVEPAPRLSGAADEAARLFDVATDEVRAAVLAILHAAPKRRQATKVKLGA
jgi:transcriptional regulator with XRE-family HTH domain